MRRIFSNQWFLIVLVLALAVGFLSPVWGQLSWLSPAEEGLLDYSRAKGLRSLIVMAVLFVMALPLDFAAVSSVLRRPAAGLLATGVNVLALPLFAWLLVSLLHLAKPSMDENLLLGILIAAATPCTLASAAVWTRRAGGNDAVAMLVTVVTNSLCFLITPAWLAVTTGQSVELDLAGMILRLVILVLLPLTAAQLLRLARPVATWSARHKKALGVAAQCGVLAVVLMASVGSGHDIARQEAALGWLDVAIMLAAVAAIHTCMLFFGLGLARALKLGRAEAIAVGFAGSQKTLMVGVDVALRYFPPLAALPMIAFHAGQLVIDTVIADRMRRRSGRATEDDARPTERS